MQTLPSDRSHDRETLKAWCRERDEILSARDTPITRLEQQVQRLLEQDQALDAQALRRLFRTASRPRPVLNGAEDLWVPEALETPVAPVGDTDTPKTSTCRGRKPLSKDLPRVRVR